MNQLKIFIDRLKNGNTEKIDALLPPSFLDIEEEDLSFPEEIHVKGQVYLADEHLIAHFAIQTAVVLPCAICNQPVRLPIAVRDHYFSLPLSEIRTPSFDLLPEVREAILLQVPQFSECEGNCPERAHLNKYLHPEAEKKEGAGPTVHFPFADLDK